MLVPLDHYFHKGSVTSVVPMVSLPLSPPLSSSSSSFSSFYLLLLYLSYLGFQNSFKIKYHILDRWESRSILISLVSCLVECFEFLHSSFYTEVPIIWMYIVKITFASIQPIALLN